MSNILPLFELPTPPPVRIPVGVKRVPLQVFGWGFRIRDLVRWANDNNVSAGSDDHEKHHEALAEIIKRLPAGYACVARIRDEERTTICNPTKFCFVVGTNKTPQDMEQALDMERIDQFRNVLGPHAPLKWHRYAGRF